MTEAERKVRAFAGTYSPDVELDHQGRMRVTHDVKPGETIAIPLHMIATHRAHGWP